MASRLLALGRWIGDRLRQRPLPTWYAPTYRLPLPALEGQLGLEPRRADFVVWYLRHARVLAGRDVREPELITWEDMSRVHTADYLESLTRAETLARIFPSDPSEIPVDELWVSVRLACGATLAAARTALARRGPTLNLLGGFHHAGPDRGGGLCAVNDIAVALAVLRAEGWSGRACVIDLDAHPPDGTAACLARDASYWIGSLSGSDWGPLPTVDETVLPPRAGDEPYLAALAGLLGRMPRPDLAFVLAGGDVLAGDHLGQLGLSLAGVRERDLRVADALDGIPSVWLPAGGYSHDAWRALAGTALALARGTSAPIPTRYNPLEARYSAIATHMDHERLSGALGDDDFDLGLAGRRGGKRLLGYYTAQGIEYALFRYGLLDYVRRLGYQRFRIVINDPPAVGDRARLYGIVEGGEHLLIDLVLERRRVSEANLLYVHWLNLRNPRAHFSDRRPQMPGQDVPGLGLAREMGELLGRMAERLGLEGVAFRPAWLHTAYAARYRMRFVDAARQGRFEAMVRDFAGVPLREASEALAGERVRMNGAPYRWEADEMAVFLDDKRATAPEVVAAVARERDRVHFSIDPTRAKALPPPPAIL